MEGWSWWLIFLSLGLVAVAAVVFVRERARDSGKTAMVAMVRRRRELSERLNALAGPNASELAQLEARRRGIHSASIEALEAAIARAERLAPKAQENAK